MRRVIVEKLLLAALVLSLFDARAFAQAGMIVQIPANANIDVVASHMGGNKKSQIAENQFFVDVPAVPNNVPPPNEVRWMEVNRRVKLLSNPHGAYVQASANGPVDWYKTQPAFNLIGSAAALALSTGESIVV